MARKPDTTVEEALAAIRAARPIVIDADAFTWLCVIGHLQLALRHPAVTGPSADSVRRIIRTIQFRMPPELQGHIEAGFDPRQDVSVAEARCPSCGKTSDTRSPEPGRWWCHGCSIVFTPSQEPQK